MLKAYKQGNYRKPKHQVMKMVATELRSKRDESAQP